MTTITLPRVVVEQALEALCGADQIDTDMRDAITALRAALAQQAEPSSIRELLTQAAAMAVAAERAGKYEGASWVADAVLEAAPQPQQAEPVAWLRVIDEAMVTHHLGVADPADDYETAKRKMNNLLCTAQDIGTFFAKTEPVQEPVAWLVTTEMQDGTRRTYPMTGRLKDAKDACDFGEPVPIYTAPPQQSKPDECV